MALDIARLGFVVDSSQVRQAVTDLGQMERQAGRAEKSATSMGRGVSVSMSALRTAAYAAAGAMGALAGAVLGGALVRTSDQYVEMTNSLRVLGMTAEQATERLNQIGDIARRTRSPLEATAQLYQRVSIASKEMGASQEDVLRFTENVGLALAQQGGSAEAASGALFQLSQALAGGVVRAEEFNSILEGAFPIAQAAANGIDKAGGSIGRLRQMMLDGEVTSKMFFDAILSQTTKLSSAFAGTVPTVGQAMQVLRDQWTLAVGQMSGGTNALSTAILRVADGVSIAASAISNNMNQIIGVVTATAAAYTAYMLPAIASTTAAIYGQIAAWVTLRGVMIATGIGAMVAIVGTLIGKFLDLAQAVGGFGNAMQAVGEYAAGVLDNMQARVGLLAEGFGAAAVYMQGVFLEAFATIARGFAALMSALSAGLSAIGINTGPGLGTQFAEGMTKKADDTIATGTALMKSVGESARALNEEAAANLNQLASRIKAAEGVASAVAGSVGGAPGVPAFGGGGGGAGGKGRGGKGGGGGQSETEKAADKAREALEKLRKEHSVLQATLGMTETQERAYRAAMELGAGATDAQRLQVMQLVPEMARLEEQQQVIRDRAEAMQQGFREMFTGIINGAKSARDAIADMASKLADMMANRAFDSLLAGGLGRFFGGDPLTAALSRIPGLATGGHINRGGWAMVGERGPELVHLPSRATVYDNRQTRGAMAGGAMTYAPVFNIGGNVTAEDLAAVRQESLANYHQMQRTMPAQVQRVNRDPLRR